MSLQAGFKLISVSEFARRLQAGPVHLVDVRNPPEFAGGHVEGAVLCPLGELNVPRLLTDLEARGFGADDTLYLICQAGMRARQAAEYLARATDAEIVVVEGGTQACAAAGLPICRVAA